MKPSKLQGHFERILGRPLTPFEVQAMNEARALTEGKRDAVKAMRLAINSAISRQIREESP